MSIRFWLKTGCASAGELAAPPILLQSRRHSERVAGHLRVSEVAAVEHVCCTAAHRR
jgi:hypothetical protein